MPTDEEISKFMLETAEERGDINARLKNIETAQTAIFTKLNEISSTVSMARGGWIACMAFIGLIVSMAGVLIGGARLMKGG